MAAPSLAILLFLLAIVPVVLIASFKIARANFNPVSHVLGLSLCAVPMFLAFGAWGENRVGSALVLGALSLAWSAYVIRRAARAVNLSGGHIDEAEQVVAQSKKDFSKVLIELGYSGEREVIQAKAQEMGFPFVDLDRVSIDSSAISAVPLAVAMQFGVIPVKKEGQHLWLAMTNPNDVTALDQVKQDSGCRIYPVLAVPAAIQIALHKYYQ